MLEPERPERRNPWSMTVDSCAQAVPSPSRRRLPPVFNAWLAHAALCSWGHRKKPHPLGFRLTHPTLTVPTFHALRNGPSTLQRTDKSARLPSDASDLWGAIVAQPGAMSIPCGNAKESECEMGGDLENSAVLAESEHAHFLQIPGVFQDGHFLELG